MYKILQRSLLFTVVLLVFTLSTKLNAAEPLSVVLENMSERYQAIFSFESNLVADIDVDFEFRDDEDLFSAVDRLFLAVNLKYEILKSKYVIVYKDTKKSKRKAKRIKRKLNKLSEIEASGSVSILAKSNYSGNNASNMVGAINDLNYIENVDISGDITADDGETLVGATILVKGTQIGTFSDDNGHYQISIPEDATTLVISYTGYETQEIEILNRTQIDVILKTHAQTFGEEIVVIGYGTTTKKDLTGSVSTVDVESMSRIKESSLDAALIGSAPGVLVTRNSGQPGEGASIKIRGLTSISGSNEPLYVVDGVPMSLDYNGPVPWNGSAYETVPVTNPLASISPEDIESITVLKDASATAIYGSRGANGVVIITTKTGRLDQKPIINISYSYSNYSPTNRIEYLTTQQWKDVVTDAYIESGETIPDDFFYNGDTDWEDAITQSAPVHQVDFSIRGGGKKTSYATSLSLFDQTGVLRNTDYKRYNGKVKVETEVFENVKIGTNLHYAYMIQNVAQRNYILGVNYRPDHPIFNEQGGYFRQPQRHAFENPRLVLDLDTDLRETVRFLGTAFGEWTIIDGLSLKSSLSLDQSNSQITGIRVPSDNPRFNLISGSRRDNSTDFLSKIFENTLTYKRLFANVHNLNIVGGVSWTTNDANYSTASTSGFPSDNQTTPNAAKNTGSIRIGNSPSGLSSQFGRISYGYNDKYLATFTIRRDGSTKFSPTNRWGIFPSGALGWVISEEDFFRPVDFIDNLKLRASAGITGSANFSDFLFSNFYEHGFLYNSVNGRVPVAIGNPNIKWERTKQLDIGLDFAILDYRLSGSVGYFKKTTEDAILNASLPIETGFASQIQNIGDISNRGVEIDLKTDIIRNQNLHLSIGGNISFVKNKIEHLNEGTGDGRSGQVSRLEEGKPFGQFFGYVVEGIIQSQEEIETLNENSPTTFYQRPGTAPGDFLFKDIDGDGRITTTDRTIIGNPHPDFYGGFSTDLSYKNLSLNTFFQFSKGNDIYEQLTHRTFIRAFENHTLDVLDAWTPTNTNTTVPRVEINNQNQNGRPSTNRVKDGSYLRLKNITLAYKLPKIGRILSSFDALTIYVSGTNLLTFTDYPGLDPEANSVKGLNSFLGLDLSVYPQNKYYTFGLSASF